MPDAPNVTPASQLHPRSIVKVVAKRLAQLEAAEQERNDYLAAMRLMRAETAIVQSRPSSPYFQGWIDGQQRWAGILIQVMESRQ